MNLVGKIFVVLVFVMSLVFMSFAVMVYATQKNWRDEIEKDTGYIASVKKGDLENAKLKKQLDENMQLVEELKAQKVQALVKLQTQNDRLAKEAQDLEARVAKADSDLKDSVGTLSKVQEALQSAIADNAKLRDDIKSVRAEEIAQFQKATASNDIVNSTISINKQLISTRDGLQKQVAELRQRLKSIGASLEPKAPNVKGLVLAVNDKEDMVEISLGRDDGLQAGNTMEVFRGNKYLGRIQITSVKDDRAVAQILKEYKQGQILQGDNVHTSKT